MNLIKLVCLGVFLLLLVGCSNFSPGELPTITSTDWIDNTPAITPPKPTLVLPTVTNTETFECTPEIHSFPESVFRFQWSKQDNSLFYTSDPVMKVWKSYPQEVGSLDVEDAIPVLNIENVETIHYFEPSIPQFSISPSGERVVFWENVYTKPTPTPAEGEVSINEFEWLLDIFIVTYESTFPQKITRIQGGIIDVYWTEDENSVFILLDQLQIPGDNFLLQVDLLDRSSETVLPIVQSNRYATWIALSPTNKWLAFKYQDVNNQVNLIDLQTKEIKTISNIPKSDSLFWVEENLWLLVKNNPSSSKFILYDVLAQDSQFEYEMTERVFDFVGMYKPVLSPHRDALAFYGSSEQNQITLHIISFCETLENIQSD